MCVFSGTETERLQLFIPSLLKMMALLASCQQAMPLEKIPYQYVHVYVFVCYNQSRSMTNSNKLGCVLGKGSHKKTYARCLK